MSLAMFDLDNTLLVGDSDYEWNNFLIEKGVLDAREFRQVNEAFLASYEDGTLDMEGFCRTIFSALRVHPIEVLKDLRATFIEERIRQTIAPQAPALLGGHRQRGDELIMVTATNDFVVEPIADLLGIETVLATHADIRDGRFTGELVGPPCFREGKIWHIESYLEQSGRDPASVAAAAAFYTDSHNDLPLMEWVGEPVAVDPDDSLREYAHRAGWRVMSLRDGSAG